MVEIIPKKPAKETLFKNVLFFVSSALLLASIFSYVIIIRTKTDTLTNLENLKGDIAKIGDREDRAIEAKTFDAERRINDFAILLASRRKPSFFFNNLESLTHPQVWFSKIELDVPGMSALVSGKSPNFRNLEQQLIFLRNQDDFIESVGLPKIAIGDEGEAEFNIDFNFKSEIFNSTSVSAFTE